MNTICFHNEGLLDLRAAMTFGVSAKETKNPFGQFGTGLKYAVAILLRTGHKVEAYIDGERFEFTVQDLEFRGSTFGQVYMNGQPLGFTTHLGEHWELWQAYRELLCNAMDEPGWAVLEDCFESRRGHTSFVVYGSQFYDTHQGREKYFLHGRTPLHRMTSNLEVHSLPENGVFFKGVRVATYENMRFSYNILNNLDLTEDRTAKYDWAVITSIGTSLKRSENSKGIKDVLTFNPLDQTPWWERRLTPTTSFASKEFLAVIQEVLNNPRLEFSSLMMQILRDAGMGAALKSFVPTELQMQMLNKATTFLEATLNLDFNDYGIVFVKDLGTGIEARADMGKNQILITKSCFNKGARYLASTLLEEVVHLSTGFSDESRALQTHLFDMLISLAEQSIGEVL